MASAGTPSTGLLCNAVRFFAASACSVVTTFQVSSVSVAWLLSLRLARPTYMFDALSSDSHDS